MSFSWISSRRNHHSRPRHHYRQPAPVFRYGYGQPYGYGYAQLFSPTPYAGNYSSGLPRYPIRRAPVRSVRHVHHHGGASAFGGGANLGASNSFGGGSFGGGGCCGGGGA
ncbi:unnamed protein product [Rotaria magnacalcarata]|uniref:Uncharacterized protein n=1 Tax=Rotaria magnacalcarata TaxID=392030 RepID=A0A815QTH2_9BILA|nr:unnamed protein product [Rotaria magnacalcarata]CAF5178113.1 unnamed protein product [Rotaria magnacalcarata]